MSVLGEYGAFQLRIKIVAMFPLSFDAVLFKTTNRQCGECKRGFGSHRFAFLLSLVNITDFEYVLYLRIKLSE